MNWLNLHVPLMRHEKVADCTPHQRGVWISLIALCADQENGGLLRDATKWRDEKWQRMAGLCKADVDAPCPLWKAVVGHIEVWGYPKEHEKKMKRMRAQSKAAADKRWGKHLTVLRREQG